MLQEKETVSDEFCWHLSNIDTQHFYDMYIIYIYTNFTDVLCCDSVSSMYKYCIYIYFKHAVYYIHHVYIFLYTLEYFCIYIFEGA